MNRGGFALVPPGGLGPSLFPLLGWFGPVRPVRSLRLSGPAPVWWLLVCRGGFPFGLGASPAAVLGLRFRPPTRSLGPEFSSLGEIAWGKDVPSGRPLTVPLARISASSA